MSANPESIATGPTSESVRVAMLGAGMSGICMGIQLRKQGIDDFVILEKADSVGGTWRENTYPGVACDVPSHVYSFSFELNPNWSHSYSSGREIWDYCERCVDKYRSARQDPLPHARNERLVRRHPLACRDRERSSDHGECRRQRTRRPAPAEPRCDRRHRIVRRRAFSHRAVGSQPESERPPRRHHRHRRERRAGAARNRQRRGRRNGVPALRGMGISASRARHSGAAARLFGRMPWLMRLYRWFLWLMMDVTGTLSLRRNSWFAERLRKVGLAAPRANPSAIPQLRARLTPDYEPGCKRRCISDDYLSTFNRSNVHLVTDRITRIEPDGVRDVTGKLHPVDVIVEATGFRPFDITDYVNIVGRDGKRLRDVWGDRVESFRTVMVSGFPNFFMLLGPNSATGHTSALIMIESQAQYVMRSLEFMDATPTRVHRPRSRRGAALQRPAAERHAEDGVQRRVQRLVHRQPRSQLHAVAVLGAAFPRRAMEPEARRVSRRSTCQNELSRRVK